MLREALITKGSAARVNPCRPRAASVRVIAEYEITPSISGFWTFPRPAAFI